MQWRIQELRGGADFCKNLYTPQLAQSASYMIWTENSKAYFGPNMVVFFFLGGGHALAVPPPPRICYCSVLLYSMNRCISIVRTIKYWHNFFIMGHFKVEGVSHGYWYCLRSFSMCRPHIIFNNQSILSILEQKLKVFYDLHLHMYTTL